MITLPSIDSLWYFISLLHSKQKLELDRKKFRVPSILFHINHNVHKFTRICLPSFASQNRFTPVPAIHYSNEERYWELISSHENFFKKILHRYQYTSHLWMQVTACSNRPLTSRNNIYFTPTSRNLWPVMSAEKSASSPRAWSSPWTSPKKNHNQTSLRSQPPPTFTTSPLHTTTTTVKLLKRRNKTR